MHDNIEHSKLKKIKLKPGSKFWQWQPKRPKGGKKLRWKELKKRKTDWSLSQNVDL